MISPGRGKNEQCLSCHHPSIISEFLQKKKVPIHIPRVVFSRKPFWAKPHCSWDYWPPQRWAKQRSPNTTCRFRQWSVVPVFGGFTAFFGRYFSDLTELCFFGDIYSWQEKTCWRMMESKESTYRNCWNESKVWAFQMEWRSLANWSWLRTTLCNRVWRYDLQCICRCPCRLLSIDLKCQKVASSLIWSWQMIIISPSFQKTIQ